jgi:hypothetical protein
MKVKAFVFLYVSYMIDLNKFDSRTSSEYLIRHDVDDTGDYSIHQYSIDAVIRGGLLGCFTRNICESVENPADAYMFAAAPQMIDEIIELRAKVAKLEAIINLVSSNLNPSVPNE